MRNNSPENTEKKITLEDLASKIDQLTSVVIEIKNDVNILKKDVAILKEDVAILKKDVAIMKADIMVMKADIEKMKKDIKDLRSDVDGTALSSANEFRGINLRLGTIEDNVRDTKVNLESLQYEFTIFKNEAPKKEQLDQIYRVFGRREVEIQDIRNTVRKDHTPRIRELERFMKESREEKGILTLAE